MNITENTSNIIKHIKSETDKRPCAIFLVGLPASGKSTFLKTYDFLNAPHLVATLSTDNYFERVGAVMGLSYSEAFKKIPFSDAEADMWDYFHHLTAFRESFFIDRTNLSVKSRGKFLDKIPDDYRKIAIVFNPNEETRIAQSDKRYADTGKIVPSGAVESMKRSFEYPTVAEGFEWIVRV